VWYCFVSCHPKPRPVIPSQCSVNETLYRSAAGVVGTVDEPTGWDGFWGGRCLFSAAVGLQAENDAIVSVSRRTWSVGDERLCKKLGSAFFPFSSLVSVLQLHHYVPDSLVNLGLESLVVQVWAGAIKVKVQASLREKVVLWSKLR